MTSSKTPRAKVPAEKNPLEKLSPLRPYRPVVRHPVNFKLTRPLKFTKRKQSIILTNG